MNEFEGGTVEQGELEKKLNDLVSRSITDKNFADSFNSPEKRIDAMKELSFTDEEIENLGPGLTKLSIERLIDRSLSVEDIISRYTPPEENSKKPDR